ncbi:MAG: alpha/beta hydrolase-fold protein [Verrucomicrobiota bacterium]|nr:alpha/beta hydrolase-fold protein [Verrucomicrobiota bacterium]
MNTRKIYIALRVILLALVLSAVQRVQAELKTEIITGRISGEKITFDIYLPESYSNKGTGYPVIYNLHGRGGSYKSGMAFRVAIKKAIANDILPPVIAVYPDGTKNGWYADSKDRSILIETHIIREIIPWVDANYNTKASRGFRMIQGFSMGGYGASLFAVKFPDLFSVCINYDGAMWNWNNMIRKSKRWQPVAPVMFGNDKTYYDSNSSPWAFATLNQDKIKGRLQFRTLVGSLGSGLQKWRDHLNSLGIEMDYVEAKCRHNLQCLHEEAGDESFRLMTKQFAKAAASPNAVPDQLPAPVKKVSEDWVHLYEPHVDDVMAYRLMKPMGFDSNKRYPVIVSLHGGGGRGKDNRKQLKDWNKLLADKQRRSDFPCYVLAPQTTRLWNGADLKNIKRVIAGLSAVDMSRIYILGHSMGGHGAYILIQIDPGYFAAAAPSAGSGRPRTEEFIDASLIKNIPIWAFHGDKDKVCPIERDRKLFTEMENLGGNMKLTTWAGDGHAVSKKMIIGGDNGSTQFSSDRCDRDGDFMRWLFKQRRLVKQQ